MSNIAQQIQTSLGVDDAMFTKRLQGSPSWGELVLMEDKIRNSIADTADLIRNVDILVTAEQVGTPEYNALTMGAMRDLKAYADRLGDLIAKRDGRTNPTQSPEEYTEYFSVGVELTSLTEQMQVVVGTTLMDLTEFQHAANEKIRARREAAEAEAAKTDVAVVSDVEEKPLTIEGVEYEIVDIKKDPSGTGLIVEVEPGYIAEDETKSGDPV